MKTSFLPVLLALASLSVPVFGTPITIGTTYTITEQNEHLTTDIPGATIGGVKDDWEITNLPGVAAGREYTPEPSGETGVNVAYSYDEGDSIVVRSDVLLTGTVVIPLEIVPNGSSSSVSPVATRYSTMNRPRLLPMIRNII